MISSKFSVVAVLAAAVAIVNAQDKGAKKQGPPPMLKITVPAFPDGARVPSKYTCAAGPNSPSPAINWSNAPSGTQSFVVILHDPDPVIANSTNDVLHWAIYDIPGNATSLPENVAKGDQSDGAKQINNIAGGAGYLGPCPPPGHGDHHYTLEVFALNAKLGIPASSSRADLMNAMNGKVLSKGVYIGIFGRN
jgi:Raf kinase inhibitor-like YbhB/YbcL family protein